MNNKAGQRRLNQNEDFVAIEIAAALARDNRVINVLVDGASIIKASEMKNRLKTLVRRQAIEVRQQYFGRDDEALVERVREALGDDAGIRRWRVRALIDESKGYARARQRRAAGEFGLRNDNQLKAIGV